MAINRAYYDFDALISLQGKRSTLIDMILSYVSTFNYNINLLLQLRNSKTHFIDSLLSKAKEMTSNLDLILSSREVLPVEISTKLFKFFFIDYAKGTYRTLYSIAGLDSGLYNIRNSAGNLCNVSVLKPSMYDVLSSKSKLYNMSTSYSAAS